jgi:peptidoglycan hydrolase-like protein with peptidoglycan-binding domain
MKLWTPLLALFLSLAIARADDKIASVQQSLKDQGFYYGEITGEKNADTTAAIRRYQIRNGLEITGELSDETLKSIHSGSGSAKAATVTATPAAPAPPTRAATPAPTAPDFREEPEDDTEQSEPPPQRFAAPPQDRQVPPVYPGGAVPPNGRMFVRTPFENAPPDVQQEVIAKAQKRLAKRDLYRGEITGVFGPDLEFSLRAYQSRVGLRPTGQLDLETLAALELLPGANQPIYTPRRGMRLPPGGEPPVRGEWIRP